MTRLLLLLALVPLCAAALDKKEESKLKRFSNQLDQVQSSFDGATREGRLLTVRQLDTFNDRLTRITTDLSALPADDADVKVVLDHLAALKSAVAEKLKGLNDQQAAVADQLDAWRKLLEADAADRETLEHVRAAFEDTNLFAPDSYIFARWTTHSTLASMRASAKAWPSSKQQLAALSAKYGEMCASRKMLGGDAEMERVKLCGDLKDATGDAGEFDAAISTFTREGPAQLEKDGAALKAATDAAVSKRDANAFLDPEGTIATLRNRVLNLAAVWESVAPTPDDAQKTTARAKALDDATETAMNTLSESIITSNKGPKSVYAGPDAAACEAAIRATWAKEFPKDAIVAVRFASSAFERHTSWEWEPSRAAFVKHDASHLLAWVVVKDGADRAILWPVTVLKLHLKGDSLVADPGPRLSRISPNRRLLLKNL